MPNRVVYCTVVAVKNHLGANIRTPDGFSFDGLIEAACTEIDSYISTVYETPVSVNAEDPDQKAAAYWLSNVASMVAAGRFMLATSAAASSGGPNQYGEYLLRTAFATIQKVLDGDIILSGAVRHVKDDGGFPASMIINQDAESQVDIYYDNYEVPGFVPGRYDSPFRIPGGF